MIPLPKPLLIRTSQLITIEELLQSMSCIDEIDRSAFRLAYTNPFC